MAYQDNWADGPIIPVSDKEKFIREQAHNGNIEKTDYIFNDPVRGEDGNMYYPIEWVLKRGNN